MIDARVREELEAIRQKLASSGALPSREKLEQYYAAFRKQFGPQVLSGLDGEQLLLKMHGLFRENRDTLPYWLEFKNDDEFPAIFGSISGGSALKYGVYPNKDTGVWMGPGENKNKPVAIGLDRAIEIARQHRDEILRGVQLLEALPASASDEAYRHLQWELNKQCPSICDTAWGHKYFSLLYPSKLDDYHAAHFQRFHLVHMLQPNIPPAYEGRFITAGRYVALAQELGMPMNHLTSVINERRDKPFQYWRLKARTESGWPSWEGMLHGQFVGMGWDDMGNLSEWQTANPLTHTELQGLSLGLDAALRTLVNDLSRAEMLNVTELRQGLDVTTSSFVGSIRLGDLQVVITPKIDYDVLATLFRYAYGLHELRPFRDVRQSLSESTFQDLLIEQLGAEVANLVARGIHRKYVPIKKRLATPRGRIDLATIVRDSGNMTASIPCLHYPRLEDNILNRALLAGARFAAWLTSNRLLRSRLLKMASQFDAVVATVPLDGSLLAHARRSLNRLTSAYEPACTLIELLYGGTGIAWKENERAPLRLPGFLFDMNRFFEALATRFLSENLRGYTVRAQHKLGGMMAYSADHNPLHRRSPTPRPDIAILRGGSIFKLLDAKYRDLWENPLPREMLYQLAIYALSQPKPGEAVIVYPTMSTIAQAQVIDIREPATGTHRASVTLRSIHLARIADMVNSTGAHAERTRSEYARYLAGFDR